jgi:hypothetical protein
MAAERTTKVNLVLGGDPPLELHRTERGGVAPVGGDQFARISQQILTMVRDAGWKGTPPARCVETVNAPLASAIAGALGYEEIRNTVDDDEILLSNSEASARLTEIAGEHEWAAPVIAPIASVRVEPVIAPLGEMVRRRMYDTLVGRIPLGTREEVNLWINSVRQRVKPQGTALLEYPSRDITAVVTSLHWNFGTVDAIETNLLEGEERTSTYFLVSQAYGLKEKWETRNGTTSRVSICPRGLKVIKRRSPAEECEIHYADAHNREVFWLKRLAKSPYVPALLHHDDEAELIVINYGGKTVAETGGVSQSLMIYMAEAMGDLIEAGCFYKAWDLEHVSVKKDGGRDQITLVGFGRAPMILTDSTCGGRVSDTPAGDVRTPRDMLKDLRALAWTACRPAR